MQKIKKPVSILLVFMMIVSLFAAVPMTVNAAPPGASLVGRYVETPGRGASNTMVFPDCDVYITGVTKTQTIHNTSVTYSHSIEGSYDVLYFNGKEVYRGDWAVPDGIRIVSGSGTSSDPYVTEWYSTPTITWKLDEDTVIDTTKVPFDVVPTHAAPTKEPDEEYTYTFAGWSPEPVAVTAAATYTATFTAVPRPYNVNVETAEHGTVTANPAEAAKGNQVTLTAEPDAGYALSSIKAFKKNTNSQQATLTALGGSSTGGEGYDKLVDGNTNTKWGFNGGSGYIIVKADKAFRLNDYSLTTANDTNNYSGRNWKNWEIYGANFASDSEAVKNSDQWQLVTSVTNDSKLQATNFTRYDYSVNTDPEAYQYYKIEISSNKGDGYTQMSELTLSGANYDVEVVLMQDSADPAKYTFEMPASNVTVKAEFEAIPTYTVTWKNGDDVLETDVDVVAGKTPTYNGTTPTKAEDENNTYTFAGWSPAIAPVTEDVTYTATFTATAKPKDLFPQHSITLDGNIGVNFYINSKTADFAHAGSAVVKFTWDGGGEDRTKEVDLTKLTPNADGYYKATCDVVAAQMAHKIHAEVYLNGEKLEQTDDYSVQDYAETVFKNPAAYDDKGKPNKLKALAKALLNYGAMAQTVFASSLKEHPELANTVVGDNGYEGVTADQIEGAIKGESADLNAVATQLGAKYYTSSLIYLSKNTLRVYFTPTTYPGTIPNADKYAGSQSDYYYYVDHANIPAAELDEQKELTVGDYTFTYTALDYAKAVVESTKMEPEQQNLAKALYLYNQAANAYFDAAPAPVQKIVDLSTLTGNYEAQNNDVLTGVLSGDKQITIADGATVTLKNADISQDFLADSAGITLLGNATILLEGTNTVMGGYGDRPGIYVPANTTLTIDGDGSLTASGQENGCGIGGGYGYDIAAGNIVINGGTITATGGECAAGIGSGNGSSCGNITINGGTVAATGGSYGAGIGSGYGATCGNIMIADTVTQVTATKGSDAPNSIGAGQYASCGTVTIGGVVTGSITDSPYTYQP